MFFWIAVIAVVAMLGGPAAAHLEVAPPIVGFGIFAGAALLGLIALIGGLVQWRRRRGGRPLLAAALGVIPLLAVIIPFAIAASRGYPPINDVSTSRTNPPTSDALSQDYPDALADQVEAAYPDVAPYHSDLDPDALAARALEVARQRPDWTLTRTDGLTIEGHASTRLFRFRDDFVIQVSGTESGSVLHMRSASRTGRSDFGVNAARITSFLADL